MRKNCGYALYPLLNKELFQGEDFEISYFDSSQSFKDESNIMDTIRHITFHRTDTTNDLIVDTTIGNFYGFDGEVIYNNRFGTLNIKKDILQPETYITCESNIPNGEIFQIDLSTGYISKVVKLSKDKYKIPQQHDNRFSLFGVSKIDDKYFLYNDSIDDNGKLIFIEMPLGNIDGVLMNLEDRIKYGL